jgi:hypothetical protein
VIFPSIVYRDAFFMQRYKYLFIWHNRIQFACLDGSNVKEQNSCKDNNTFLSFESIVTISAQTMSASHCPVPQRHSNEERHLEHSKNLYSNKVRSFTSILLLFFQWHTRALCPFFLRISPLQRVVRLRELKPFA